MAEEGQISSRRGRERGLDRLSEEIPKEGSFVSSKIEVFLSLSFSLSFFFSPSPFLSLLSAITQCGLVPPTVSWVLFSPLSASSMREREEVKKPPPTTKKIPPLLLSPFPKSCDKGVKITPQRPPPPPPAPFPWLSDSSAARRPPAVKKGGGLNYAHNSPQKIRTPSPKGGEGIPISDPFDDIEVNDRTTTRTRELK